MENMNDISKTIPGAGDIILLAKGIQKHYPAGKGETLEVLRGVDMEVGRGEVVAIVGASGTGKSTLLHIIGALDRPTQGDISIDGFDMFSLDDVSLSKFRNKNMGFVFQFHHLLPEFTAVENVAMPAMIAGKSLEQAQNEAMELLRQVQVDSRAQAKPSEMSGGEQQRVAVARALINNPAFVLADEPSGNLDEENAARLHDLLWDLAREKGQTFVIVTHDKQLASRADSLFVLHDGKLLRE